MDSKVFQGEILQAIEAQIKAYSVPGASVLGGFIQRSRTCVAQYNGRQIFEMLQNMDDQMTEDGLKDDERCSLIVLNKKNGKLLFRNKGAPFSVAGIVSIMYPDVSPKRKGKLPTIGNKGLGFRSLLNWKPKEIVIRSNETELVFSDKVASAYVTKYQELKNALSRADEEQLPMLSFPEIKQWEDHNTGWATEIELTDITEFVDDIQKELNDFDSELMLFLPHLRQVEIHIIEESHESKAIYQASKRKQILEKESRCQTRTIRNQKDGCNWVTREWLVCWDRGTLIGEKNHNATASYNIEIAVPKDGESRKTLSKKLYNYLPVSGVNIKLPCLIHATVNLGDNRNELLIGDWQNQIIFNEKLPVIIRNFATIIRDQFLRGNNLVDDRWLPYSLLAAPLESDDRNYVGPLYEKLRAIVDSGEFVPCVDQAFHKLGECCYYEQTDDDGCNITQFFNAHSEFMPYYVLSGVPADNKFPGKPIGIESLKESVNKALTEKTYSDDVIVELAYVLWRIVIRSSWKKAGPYWLLHDFKRCRLGENCHNVYTPAGEESLEFPEYMNADFVDKDLWQKLLKRFSDVIDLYKTDGSNAVRSFCDNELKAFLNIEYYDRARAAKKIISSAKEFLAENSTIQKKREVVSQLLNSLWKNFRGDAEPHPRKEEIPLFVEESGKILYACDFLFGEVSDFYDGKLDGKCFLSKDMRRQLLPEIVEEDQEIAFFRFLGVRSDVRVKYVTIRTNEGTSNSYLRFLQNIGPNSGGLPQSVGNGNALEEEQVFVALQDPQVIKELNPNAFFELLRREKMNGLSELILETRSLLWKALHGKEFYPVQVKWSYVAYQLHGMFDKVIYGENDKVLSDLGWRYEQSRGDVPTDLIMKLGAKSRFSDLSSSELYKLLRTIDEKRINPTKDFYKKVNAAFVNLEKNGQTCTPPQNLRVFATWMENDVERQAYCPVNEVFYHDNPAHVRALVRGRKMFFLGARVGVDSVCRHFGVQKLDEGLLNVKNKEMVSGDMQASFENDYLKKCPTLGVILCRHISKNIEDCRRDISGIQIKLVSSIKYSYDDGPDCDLAIYDYIRDRNSSVFYLCVGELQSLSQLDNTGLRKLSRSLSGILCDTVKLSNDELEREFEGCFFDLETAKEDLKDLGYEDLIDANVNVKRNYYRQYQGAFQNLADTIWSMFLKPTIWAYLNANRDLQKFYRACELGYRDFVSKAKDREGGLDRYCIEKQYDVVPDEDLKQTFLSLIKGGQWIPEDCRNIQFDWEKIVQNEPEPWNEPSFSENYPDIDVHIDDELNEEVLSLMSFAGNDDRIKELLNYELPIEGPDGAINEGDIDTSPVDKDISLVENGGGVVFLRPKVASLRGLNKGSGRAMTNSRQKSMQKRGAEAELCVIKWLKDKGYVHVEGKSGTSLNSGRNDSLHYDISYVDDSKTYYVEVKACDSGEFHISSGELEFAKKNSETYRLALVYLETARLQIVDDVYNKLKDFMVAENWRVAIKNAP